MKNKHLAILLLLALAAGSGGCSTQPSQPQTAQTAQDVQAPSAPAIQADSQAYSDEGLKKYTTPEHYLNLGAFVLFGLLSLAAWTFNPSYFELARTFIYNLFTFNFQPLPSVFFTLNLLVGFFTGLSSGATVIISQYYGAQNHENVKKSVHTSIALSLAGGAIIMILGLIFSGAALQLMNTPDDIMKLSLTYMRIYFLGVIPSLIYNMGSGILRAAGDAKRPLYFLIISCFINIILDIFFVVVLKLGVAGVAIATTLSQVASAVMVLAALMRTTDSYKLYIREIRFAPAILKHIIRIGLPAGLQSTMYSVSNLIIQASINAFGTDTIAAWTAYGKVDGIFWMIMGAYGVAITTFAGQNFGAGKYDRIHKSVKVCLGMAAFTSVLLSAVVLLGGRIFFRLFTSDDSVIDIGLHMMAVISPSYITYICIEILGGTARGCGDSIIPMLLTCFGICVLRVIWILVIVPLRPDVSTVAFSYPLTWTVTSVMFIIYYLRGNWLKRRRGLQ